MTPKQEDKLTEYRLIEGCVKGDRRSQELIYQLFAKKMFGICLRYTNNEFEAQEVLQLGFIKLFDKMKAFKNEGSFEGYLRRIMVNTAIEYFRKKEKALYRISDHIGCMSPANLNYVLDKNPKKLKKIKLFFKTIKTFSSVAKLKFQLF